MGRAFIGRIVRAASLILVGAVVLASASLAPADARAAMDSTPSGFASLATLPGLAPLTSIASDGAIATPGLEPLVSIVTSEARAAGVAPLAIPKRGAAHAALRPASAPSSTTRHFTRAPGARRHHARLRHSEASLRAHRVPASSMPGPARRPARPRVPTSGRHAPSPQVQNRDGGTRSSDTPGLPAAAAGALSLAMLGTCVNQRNRPRHRRGLERLESRGPPRGSPNDPAAAPLALGAPAHLISRPTHPPGWAPRPGASRTSPHSRSSRHLLPPDDAVAPRSFRLTRPAHARASALEACASRAAAPAVCAAPASRVAPPSFPEVHVGGRKPLADARRGRVIRKTGPLDLEELS